MLFQSKESSKSRVENFQSSLDVQEREYKNRERDLQGHLDEVCNSASCTLP